MVCNNCGKELLEGAPFCPYCGTRVSFDSGESEIEIEVKKSEKVAEFTINQFPGLSKAVLTHITLMNQARACFFGNKGTIQNYHRAAIIFEYLYKEYHDNYAAYYLAQMYEAGIYYTQDIAKAVKYYKEAIVVTAPYRIDPKDNENVIITVSSESKAEADCLALLKLGKILITVQLPNSDNATDAGTGIACIIYACEKFKLHVNSVINYTQITNSMIRGQLYDWQEKLFQAQKNDSESIAVITGLYYLSLPDPLKMDAATKWATIGISLGIRICEYIYCNLMLEKDNKAYAADPDNYETYRFNDNILEIINTIFNPDVAEPLSKEVLVVHSAMDIENILNRAVNYFHKYHDQEAANELSKLLLPLANIASSFHRPKPGLPGFK